MLGAVREALNQGEVVPGEFVERDEDDSAFAWWGLTPDETIARIEREWSNLGREPNLGETAWLVASSLLPLTALRRKGWKPKSA